MAYRSMDGAGSRYLSTLFGVGVIGDLTDGQLLERFIGGRDESAEAGFTALVERHGPMVHRVCRQVLGDAHEAEDAFQATFLVLARRASSIRKRESVASWFYGIAQRVARRSRADAARRRDRERRRATMTMTTSELSGVEDRPPSEGWPELHEEVDRLPEKYREPIVLCYLEGLTTEAAARRLGCAQGTVLSRLSRARDRLRKRLTRRGLAPTFGLITAGVSADTASAAVPAALAHSLVKAAMSTVAATTVAGVVPTTVSALTEGVLKMLIRDRLRGLAVVVLTIGALSAGLRIVAYRTARTRLQEARPVETARPAPPAPVSVKENPSRTTGRSSGEIVVGAVDFLQNEKGDGFKGIAAIDPETAKWRTISNYNGMISGRVSPDGRYLVARGFRWEPPDPEDWGVWIYDLTHKTPPRRIFQREGEPFWSNDGRQVIIDVTVGTESRKSETWRLNADGSGPTRLPISDIEAVVDCSRDGTWLATQTIGGEPAHKGRLGLIHPDGTGARYLTEGSAKDDRFSGVQISPDGRRVAYAENTTVKNVCHSRLFVVDIDGTNRHEIPIRFDPGMTVVPYWSPDGSRLALLLFDQPALIGGSLERIDLDGSNRRVLVPPGRWQLIVWDWKPLTPDIRPLNRQTNPSRSQALREE